MGEKESDLPTGVSFMHHRSRREWAKRKAICRPARSRRSAGEEKYDSDYGRSISG